MVIVDERRVDRSILDQTVIRVTVKHSKSINISGHDGTEITGNAHKEDDVI